MKHLRMEKIIKNCATCGNFIKGKLCKKLSVRINERDLEVEIKCKYYAYDSKKNKATLGEGEKAV